LNPLVLPSEYNLQSRFLKPASFFQKGKNPSNPSPFLRQKS
jgi:hypothetical protein